VLGRAIFSVSRASIRALSPTVIGPGIGAFASTIPAARPRAD
jgi:hypothetical protein